MTDYTITTNFGAKDSLPSGNAGKVIKGSEFTTEFTNIQTAVNTKADTAGDTFTGVVNFSADVAVNTNTLFVDVSEAKVGIGTTSPASRLAIHGAADVAHIVQTNTANSQKLEIGNAFSLYTGASGSVSAIASDSTLAFATNDAERMRIDSSGKVGIGTTSPAYPLDVDGLIASRDAYLITSNSSGTPSAGAFMFRPASNTLALGTNSTEHMRIDSSGNVGIGTTSPSFKLDVAGNARASYFALRSNETAPSESSFIYRPDTGVLGFGTGNAERMRIDSSGNVLVGTTDTTPYDNTTGSGICWGGGTNRPNSIARESTSTCLILNKTGTQAGSTGIQDFRYDGTSSGTIAISSTAVAYNTSSDERLKENIADSTDASSKVDAIQIRQFDWKADGSHQDYGVIAQELATVAPEAVHQPEDSEDMMGVDYSKLVPMLIKEVQSLRSRVAELENV